MALDDLDEIAQYIERDSPAVARRLVQRIFDRVDKLERFPRSGGFIPEDSRQIYRQLIQGNYRVIYRCDEHDVFIVAIYHGARLLPSSRIP